MSARKVGGAWIRAWREGRLGGQALGGGPSVDKDFGEEGRNWLGGREGGTEMRDAGERRKTGKA
jgi:hypothetical protein